MTFNSLVKVEKSDPNAAYLVKQKPIKKEDLRTLMETRSIKRAINRYYETETLDPEQGFPILIEGTALFAKHDITDFAKRHLKNIEKPNLVHAVSVTSAATLAAAGGIVLVAGVGMGIATFPIVLICTLLGGSMGAGISDAVIGGQTQQIFELCRAHSSSAKNKAFVRWVKDRYAIEITKESVAKMWESRFLEDGDNLYAFDHDEPYTGTLRFATVEEKAVYYAAKDTRPKLEGELPLVITAKNSTSIAIESKADLPEDLEYLEV